MTSPAFLPPSAAAVHALRAAAAHAERMLARALEPYGVTAAQFELLQVIGHHEGKGSGCSELGRQLAVPGPDVTRLMDRLDSAGLVARSRDEKDRRVVHTTLTKKGRELLRTASPIVADTEVALFDGLDDDERARLTELLQGIRRACPGN